MIEQVRVPIINELGIVTARQKGREISKKLLFNSVDQARITTAISELARNIYLYAGNGEIIIEVVYFSGKTGLKITAADAGPGITDVRQAMQMGYTSSNGLGAGLPGVKRLMDEFSLETEPGKGTVITATKWIR